MTASPRTFLLIFLLLISSRAAAAPTFQAGNDPQRVMELRATLVAGSEVKYLAASPDGKVIAVIAADRSLQLWDTANATPLGTFTGFEKSSQLHWSPDSSRLLITDWGKTAAVWVAEPGTTELRRLDLERDARSTCWSPNSRFLLTTHRDALVDVWDMEKLSRQFELKLRKDATEAHWSPDSSAFMTVVKETSEWKLSPHSWIQLWDVESGKEKFTIRLNGPVKKAQFNANGKFILTAGSWEVPELWDAANGKLHSKLNPPWCRNANCGTDSAELSLDGNLVVTDSNSWQNETWDVASGKFLASVETGKGGRVYIRGFSPDGRLLAVYDEHFKSWKSFAVESSVQLYDTRTGKLTVALTGRNMMDSTHQFVWSADSKTLVTAGGSQGYQGKIWDVASGELRSDLSLSVKYGWAFFVGSYLEDFDELSFHPTKPVLIGTSQKLLKFWNPANGELLQTIAGSEPSWSKDGRVLGTMTADKKSLHLWRLVS